MKYGDVVIKRGELYFPCLLAQTIFPIGDGSLLSVPAVPKIGYAILLQGGYVQAPAPHITFTNVR
jgi:hypothetical protein